MRKWGSFRIKKGFVTWPVSQVQGSRQNQKACNSKFGLLSARMCCLPPGLVEVPEPVLRLTLYNYFYLFASLSMCWAKLCVWGASLVGGFPAKAGSRTWKWPSLARGVTRILAVVFSQLPAYFLLSFGTYLLTMFLQKEA